MIWAYLEVGNQEATPQVAADYLKIADIEAVRRQLDDRIVAATGVMQTFTSIVVNGRERDIQVNGSDEQYPKVRNLVILAGRFLDSSDVTLRQKVALVTGKLARRLFRFRAGGGRAARQDPRVAVHGDRRVQGESVELRALRVVG